MWTHFKFASGCNPYISMAEDNARKLLRRFKRKGYGITLIKDGFYLIDDKEALSYGPDCSVFKRI